MRFSHADAPFMLFLLRHVSQRFFSGSPPSHRCFMMSG